jgi:cyclohexyl-isocyanide hydratase
MDLQIGMLLFPQLTQLDLAGPFEVLSRLSETRVLLLWKSLESITSDTGMSILPTTTFGSVRNSTLYSCRADQVRSH